MSDLLLGGMLPRRWTWDPIKAPFIEIIIDWQFVECDPKAEIEMPLLCRIRGHRRREVMSWFDETREYRDALVTQSLYGSPGAFS